MEPEPEPEAESPRDEDEIPDPDAIEGDTAADQRKRRLSSVEVSGSGRSRSAVADRIEKEQARLQSLMRKYDVNESGDLDRDQLTKMMTDYNNKVPPNEHEIDFVFKMADARKTGSISDVNEIKSAVGLWKGLQRDMELLDARYDFYDKSKTGTLEEDELKTLLTDLNEGIPPSKAEVKWVLSAADQSLNRGVDREELRAAIAVWYSTSNVGAARGGAATEKKSSACAIL